jgi:radical SAM protein with 4Fe4S-binding SPASM domain
MYYQQKFDTFIRQFGEIGYITNNSNFNDRIFDASGAIFIKPLSREPKSIDDLVNEIVPQFKNITADMIRKDVIDFYNMLEEDGFIVSAPTPEETIKKDIHFKYNLINPETIKNDFSPSIRRANKDTQEFLFEYFKGNPFLYQINIELTSRCNERCVHCYIPHEKKTDDIEPLLFYNVLEQCSEIGVLELVLSGGEPLLHKKFLDFLNSAKNYDFSVSILSNLTLLNDEIVAAMKSNRLSSVQVSLYSMNANVHDKITQLPGSFQKTIDGILTLIENDIPLQISCPSLRQNKNDFIDVLKWANEHKVRAMTDYNIMARYDHTTDNLENRLSVEDVEEIINGIILNDYEYQREIQAFNFEEQEQRNRDNDIVCGVGTASLCIISNGNVYPCPGWQSYILGNLKEKKLADLWENSSEIRYLRNIRKKDFIECRNCESRGFCALCMARNANESATGNIFEINKQFCDITKLNRRLVLEWRKTRFC